MTEPINIKPAGRTLAEFLFLKPAEKILLEHCRLGMVAKISEERPEDPTEDNTVRADFLRFLALGGDEQAPVHEHGVRLYGAWIEGELDMEGCKVPSSLIIAGCHFNISPVLLDTKISGSLILSGCHLPGLAGGSLVCDGSLFLRDQFIATGEVRLLDAQIGGNLDCRGAAFDGRVGDGKCEKALSADRAVVKGDVSLNGGFAAIGEVRLRGAQIGGNLDCSGAAFDGRVGEGKYEEALSADSAVVKGNVFLNEGFTATGHVFLSGAQIDGNLDCSGATFDGKGGDSLLADGMVVEGVFLFRNLVSPVSEVSLASVHVGQLADDATSWGEGLVLDGFTCGSISGGAPTDADARLTWLNKQRKTHAGLNGDGAEFKPQPWRQLIKVLREMGHAEDARQVAIAFEHRLREANLIGQTPKHWGVFRSWIYRKLSRWGHWLFWVFTGFGYRPMRLLGWIFGVWLACAIFYWVAALCGVFAPSSPLVFQNPAYAICKPDYVAPVSLDIPPGSVRVAAKNSGNWYLCEKLPEEYSGFSPLAYSLDVILPLVDLQQETSWAPLIPTPNAVWYKELAAFDLKYATRLVLWGEILFGWVSSLLLVAVVSGLTKRRED